MSSRVTVGSRGCLTFGAEGLWKIALNSAFVRESLLREKYMSRQGLIGLIVGSAAVAVVVILSGGLAQSGYKSPLDCHNRMNEVLRSLDADGESTSVVRTCEGCRGCAGPVPYLVRAVRPDDVEPGESRVVVYHSEGELHESYDGRETYLKIGIVTRDQSSGGPGDVSYRVFNHAFENDSQIARYDEWFSDFSRGVGDLSDLQADLGWKL